VLTCIGDLSDVLMQVVVPIVSWDTCRESNGIYKRELTDNMICAGYMEGGKDSCGGDSGGPLVRKRGGSWYQYGVVTWGDGCALPNAPGVYADVVKFLPWIKEKTGSQYLRMSVSYYFVNKPHV